MLQTILNTEILLLDEINNGSPETLMQKRRRLPRTLFFVIQDEIRSMFTVSLDAYIMNGAFRICCTTNTTKLKKYIEAKYIS